MKTKSSKPPRNRSRQNPLKFPKSPEPEKADPTASAQQQIVDLMKSMVAPHAKEPTPEQYAEAGKKYEGDTKRELYVELLKTTYAGTSQEATPKDRADAAIESADELFAKVCEWFPIAPPIVI